MPHIISKSINGTISDNHGQPIEGLVVIAYRKTSKASFETLGQPTLTNGEGKYIIYHKGIEGPIVGQKLKGINIFIRVFIEDNLMAESAVLRNVNNDVTINATVNIKVSCELCHLKGIVQSLSGKLAGGVSIQIWRKDLFKEVFLGSADSNTKGLYSIAYNRIPKEHKLENLNLILKVYETNLNLVYESPTLFNIPKDYYYKLILPQEINSPTEYERLLNELKPYLGNQSIAELKEDDKNDQISYLTNKTGWDARAIAMAAQSEKLFIETGVPSAYYYANFRSGLVSDAKAINRLTSKTFGEAVKKAIEVKIIPSYSEPSINQAIEKHRQLNIQFALNKKAVGGMATLEQMLDIRTLSKNQKEILVEALQLYQNDPTEFWQKLGDNKLPVEQLKLDGKLGYLTFNNVNLIKKLINEKGISDPVKLAHQGYYNAQAWKYLLATDGTVPEGLTVDQYAGHMAALVKRSYPTESLGAIILEESNRLITNGDTKREVGSFFKSNSANFKIGSKPINTVDGFRDLTREGQLEALRIERLYQLSPSDQAMVVLADEGLDSSGHILQYTKEEFVNKFQNGEMLDAHTANVIYAKAHQIHSTVVNLATSYLALKARPNIYALSGKNSANEQAPSHSWPTLEALFGEMDYCECKHCRSVLSPAAYLVDLLQFLNTKISAAEGLKTPIDELLSRRPDIEYLQLTCENTNTALPYLDLVNEILEYWICIKNEDPSAQWQYQGYNTPQEVSSDDLLADPLNVKNRAYYLTQNAKFPVGLPFDRNLEGMRLLFKTWNIQYADVLKAFGINGEDEDLLEGLGFSLSEFELLTDNVDSTQIPFYLGFDNGEMLVEKISNAAAFCRHVNISYEDLVKILNTRYLSRTIELYETQPNADLCSFNTLEIRLSSNHSRLENVFHWLKIILFIRFWKKLNLTIEEADLAISVLSGINDFENGINNIVQLNSAFNKTIKRLAYIYYLKSLLKIGNKKISTLINLWDIKSQESSKRRTQWSSLLQIRAEDFNALADMAQFNPDQMIELREPSAISEDFNALADMAQFNPDQMIELREPSVISFVNTVVKVKNAGLKTDDLAFLLNHQDKSGKLTVSKPDLLQSLQTIKGALEAVEIQIGTIPEDPDLDYARAKMALMYNEIALDAFFAILNNTIVFAIATNFSEPITSPPDDFMAIMPSALSYDALNKNLTYKGVLSNNELNDFKKEIEKYKFNEASKFTEEEISDFKDSFKGLLINISEQGSNSLKSLFSQFPELEYLYSTFSSSDDSSRITNMLVEVLKDLREKIQSQVITQTLSSILKMDVKSVEKIVTDKDILLAPIPHIHPNPLPESRPYTSTIKTDPIYTCFLKLLDGVLSEWSNNGTSTFYLQAPTNYNFDVIIKAPEQTIITFSINGIEKEMEVGEVGQVIYKVDAALKTGQLYPVSVIIKNLPQNSKDKVSLYCQLPGKVVTPVPPNLLISSTTADTAMGALTRLLKVSQLQKIVKFTADEMAYWGRTLRIDNRGWMNSIPTQPLENIEKKKALWQTISVLASYIKIKKEVNVSPELWIQILGNPEILAPNGKKLLGEITGWKETDINDVLSKLNLSWENLSNIDNLLKIKPALDLVNQTGLSAKDVIGFITGEVSLDDARSIVRQKIGDVAWREKAGVVTDPLRKMQRDALVQLILFKYRPPGSIDTPNKLYEHFLIDIEMDACMKTSRILQAISVVQLFVQRCFLNLEPNVDISPILLRREQWEWMKRYRVWEAGRKIFLYPENWLEPEFRDDKSYMFRDLESELLKTDINRELAETAYINYIQKLDNIARLEICGMYLEESESGNQYDDVLHVIARTTGTDWHYFYRRLCGTWSPWEKVDLTINSDQVLPVVLNGRLYLLWLSIMEKTEPLDDTLEVYKYAEKIIGEITKKYFEIKLNIAGYINYKWSVIKSDDGFCKVAFDDYKINSPKDIKLYIGRIVKENKIVFTILPFKEYVIGDISDKKALITSFDKINVHLPNMREINEIPAPFDHITSIWSYNQNRSNGNFRELEGKFIMYNSERHILKIVDGHMVKMMPIWHSIIFQQESPVCIMDDNAVFMVKPKEEIFPAIYEWHSYLDSWNMQNMNQEPFTLSSMSESLGYWENGKKQFKENSKITFEASDSEITNFKQLQIDQIFEYNGFSLDALGKRQLTQAFPDEIQTPKGTNKNINH